MPEILLFLRAVFAHWIAGIGVILTFTPFVPHRLQKWIEENIVKDKFSFKHLWVLGCLFVLMAFYQAWQDEHRIAADVMKDKSHLTSEEGFWKDQSYAKDGTIRDLVATLLAMNKPEPKQYVFFHQRLNDKAFQMIVTTNKPHPSVNLVMDCDGDFQSFNLQVVRSDEEPFNLGAGGMHGKREAELIAFSPAWDQMHPLVVNIFGASPQLKTCNLKPL